MHGSAAKRKAFSSITVSCEAHRVIAQALRMTRRKTEVGKKGKLTEADKQEVEDEEGGQRKKREKGAKRERVKKTGDKKTDGF